MADPTKAARNQTIDGPFLVLLQDLRATRDERLPIVLKTAHLNGWTYDALGTAIRITREGVRLKIKGARLRPDMELPDVPIAPRNAAPLAKPAKPVLRIKPEVAERLREMQAVAERVTGGVPVDDPRRRVSEEYTALLASLVEQGVTMYEITKTLGLSAHTVNYRLARHGYRKPSPSQEQNGYKNQQTRLASQPEFCKYGHPLSGENLRVVPKTGARVCKTCDRRRSAEYNDRKRAAAGRTKRPYRRRQAEDGAS